MFYFTLNAFKPFLTSEPKLKFFFCSSVMGHFLQECQRWCPTRYSLSESSPTGSESGWTRSGPVSGGGSTKRGEAGGGPSGGPVSHQSVSGMNRAQYKKIFKENLLKIDISALP